MPSLNVVDHPYRLNVESLFEAVRDLPDPIWLDSGKPRSLQGRFDIISAAPIMLIEGEGEITTISRRSGSANVVTQSSDNPFHLAQQVLEEVGPVPDDATELPFCGGLAGYFGYAAGQEFLSPSKSLGSSAPLPKDNTQNTVGLPDLRLGYYTWALIVNHQSSKAWVVFHPACSSGLRNDVMARLSAATADLRNNTDYSDGNIDSDKRNFELSTLFKASMTRKEYNWNIAVIKDYISAGDCYQVNFSQHFSATYKGDPWFAYKQLRSALPSPFSAFMAWDDKAILSLSPERFIKLSGSQVETRPIKGTVARGLTVEEDREKAIALMNSAKDRAENLMIVDLLRNDLGKSCEPGSIRVPKLFNLESFANVHHLVSTVTGTLSENKTALDLLTGCFPGGSITGAPKKRAMEIIRETEQVDRSIYCGSIGYISACGRMDTNIAIRTLAANAGKIHCWGGGGIIADSDTDSEYAESLSKISLLMDTLASS